jgi:hypothetical protein
VSDRQYYDGKSNIPYSREVNIRFFPAAGGAPTFVAADNQGVASIARTSQGLYTITLNDPYVRFIAGYCQLQINAALGVGRAVFLGAVANVGTGTPVTVQVFFTDGAGAVQDPPAANANNSISVELYFADIAAV